MIATIVTVIIVYGQVLRTLFVGDDFAILHLIRTAGGLQNPGAYFRLDFFGFYRPIAFLSQAFDWTIWREQAFGFHLTSLLLHAANAALVLVIGTRLFGRTEALIGALLFALHPSNHEAVFWMSSRFDLLATLFMLLALLAITPVDPAVAATPRDDAEGIGRTPWTRRSVLRYWWMIACFGLALLCKESAFALPLIVLAYDVFVARRNGRAAVRRMLPVLVVMVGYLVIRLGAGGPELGRGLERFAKIFLLGGGLAVLVSLASAGTERTLAHLARGRRKTAAVIGVALLIALLAAVLPLTAGWMRPKLAFAGFAGFYLLSPIITLGGSAPLTFDPNLAIYWLLGWTMLAGAGVVLTFGWRPASAGDFAATSNGRLAFLVVFIAAALLPISSMTEGKRYLYLASIGISLLAGWAIGALRSTCRKPAMAAVAIVLGVSAWQIQLKARDWTWAGGMTRDAVRLVRSLNRDPCQPYAVLFLTAPVGIRDVYSHFYDYTFEDPATRCRPQYVRAVVRVVGRDVTTVAAWAGPQRIVFEARGDTDRLVASADLRQFDVPLFPASSRHLGLPIGSLEITPFDGGQRFDLRLARGADALRPDVLYYGDGRVMRLPPWPAGGR